MKPFALLLTATLLLIACSDQGSGQPEPLAPQQEALKRAEGVEQMLDEAAARQRRLIEEQGG